MEREEENFETKSILFLMPRIIDPRTSPVIQRLRIHLPSRGLGLIPGLGRCHMSQDNCANY